MAQHHLPAEVKLLCLNPLGLRPRLAAKRSVTPTLLASLSSLEWSTLWMNAFSIPSRLHPSLRSHPQILWHTTKPVLASQRSCQLLRTLLGRPPDPAPLLALAATPDPPPTPAQMGVINLIAHGVKTDFIVLGFLLLVGGA